MTVLAAIAIGTLAALTAIGTLAAVTFLTNRIGGAE